MKKIIRKVKPDEIYHLAAILFVPASLKNPKLTFDTNLDGLLTLYGAVIETKSKPKILFVGSDDEYGLVKKDNLTIKEDYLLRPENPYGIIK